jgi:tetratricopeptide (TPR) repeat protein
VKIHPSDLLLEELLFRLGGDRHAIMGHLARCRYCQQRLDTLKLTAPDLAGAPAAKAAAASTAAASANRLIDLQTEICTGSLPDYGALIEKTERQYFERTRVLDRERIEARALLAELLGHPRERRRLLLANSARFHNWGVYEHLLDRSWELRTIATSDAEELAHLAILLSDHLDAEYYTPELIEDLRARAWSYVANLRRMVSDLDGAERAIRSAYDHLKIGTKEPLERAAFLELKGILRNSQRRFDEAMAILRRAFELFQRSGDDLRAGRCLIGLAHVHDLLNQPERAIEVLQSALPLIAAEDGELFLLTRHNLICFLTSAGRYIEAQGLYRKVSHLYSKFEGRPLGNRRLWIKGKIELGLGQDASAEAHFLQARERFLEKNIPYEAALVSLDLAALYADQHRTAELRQLAVEMLPIFTSRKIHREAVAAFTFLVQAVEAERATVEVVAQIATFVQRVQADPTLKFDAPSA